MWFLNKIFSKSSKEIKALKGVLAEADQRFEYPAFNIIKQLIDNELRKNEKEYVQSLVETEETPRQLIYALIVNIAGDLAESGQYHMYRGVLNPLGLGMEFLKIYDLAVLVKHFHR